MPIARILTMKRLIHKLVTIITLFILPYSLANAAGCIFNPQLGKTSYLPVDNIIIQSDKSIAVNSLLKRYTINVYPAKTYLFTSGSCSYISASQYLNGWLVDSSKIARTNINGIGIRITFGTYYSTGTNYSAGIPYTSATQTMQGYAYFSGEINWFVDIIKIGPISNSNGQTLKMGDLAERYYYDNTAQKKIILAKIAIPSNFRITLASCTINGVDTHNINLGDWDDKKFKNIGDTSNNVDIPITLSCVADTNIKVNVTSSSIDNAPTGKLSLAGTDRATGIAVQLLNNSNSPIALNTQWTQQDNVSEGDYFFNWKARYIKTANIVTPGTANASATVNIRYE
ncbi:fimbrial protein [Providencia sp. PROV212]|uniref:fimbrial protein n=1 Tax=Providencia sp. PROV212 TaxID=2949909 RepID=UPI0023499BDA|nr:fimbrial protein [Providencia sp. PROV212]